MKPRFKFTRFFLFLHQIAYTHTFVLKTWRIFLIRFHELFSEKSTEMLKKCSISDPKEGADDPPQYFTGSFRTHAHILPPSFVVMCPVVFTYSCQLTDRETQQTEVKNGDLRYVAVTHRMDDVLAFSVPLAEELVSQTVCSGESAGIGGVTQVTISFTVNRAW